MNLIRKYIMKYLWHKYKVSYRARQIEVTHTPREVWLEPTNHCNLRCVMCPQGKGLSVKKGFMDIGLYTRVVEELKAIRVQRINLFLGGESLLHKKLPEMLRIARSAGIPVRLHTNATLLTLDMSALLLEKGMLEEISFSFDGEEKDYYERVRVNADYEKTLANIKRFLELKKERGLKKPRVLVQVIKERTADDRPPEVSDSFKALFAGLPVDKLHPICFHNFGGTLDAKGDVKYELSKKEYKPCCRLWNSLSVAWDGEVVGCCLDMEKKVILGNLNHETVLNVWNGGPLKDFRKLMIEKRYKENELCKECDMLWR